MRVFQSTILGFILFSVFACSSSKDWLPARNWSTFQSEQFAQFRLAHRGGYADGPENAISTILYTLKDRGTNAVEVDIRLTKDHHLVLFHDETVERILQTDEKKLVSEMTLAEITSIPYRDTTHGEIFVPVFSDFVDSMVSLVAKDSLQFMVELDFKPHGEELTPAINELVKTVEEIELLYGDTLYHYFYVGTFYPDVLKAIREKSDKITTAFAVHNAPSYNKILGKLGVLLSPMVVRKYGVAGIEPYLCLVNKRYVKRWQKRGCFINAWTANRACEKEYLAQFPVAVTTNCPGTNCDNDPSDETAKAKSWCKKCSEK